MEGDLREILELMADDVQVWSAWKGAGQSYTGTGKEGVEGYFRFAEAALDIDRTKFSVRAATAAGQGRGLAGWAYAQALQSEPWTCQLLHTKAFHVS